MEAGRVREQRNSHIPVLVPTARIVSLRSWLRSEVKGYGIVEVSIARHPAKDHTHSARQQVIFGATGTGLELGEAGPLRDRIDVATTTAA